MKLKYLMIAAAALAMPVALTAPANADGGVFVGVSGSDIAVGGYDTVSYFQGSGTPVRGNASFKVMHDGAEYLFSSQSERRFVRRKSGSLRPAIWRPLRLGDEPRLARTG